MRKPSYILDEVKQLTSVGKFTSSKRVLQWLSNHGYGKWTIEKIIMSLDEGDFYKSDELEKRPGIMADIYRTTYDEENWYVKFFIDEDSGCVSLRVWSCVIDGYLH